MTDFLRAEEDRIRREILGDHKSSAMIWREDPLNLHDFIKYALKEPPLTDIQYYDVTQVVGEDPKLVFTRKRKNQLGVLAWSKGSGKNYVITKVNAWVLHIIDCMCDARSTLLKSDTKTGFIEVVNVARNAKQAKGNFFDVLIKNILNCEYFLERYKIRQKQQLLSDFGNEGTIEITRDEINFPTGVRCISTHSDTQSVEGINPIFFTFDEYSSFNLGRHGDILAKDVAKSAFDNIETSAQSRYEDYWAGFVISYLRHEFTADTEPTMKLVEMGKDADYGIYGVVRPHWEVRTDKNYSEFFEFPLPESAEVIKVPTAFSKAFNRDYRDALARYAGILPSSQIIDFFQDKGKIEECAFDYAPIVTHDSVVMGTGIEGRYYNGINVFYEGKLLDFKSNVVVPPNIFSIPRTMHVDMSHKADRTSLVMGHKDFNYKNTGDTKVVVDLILVWEADPIRGRLISVDNVEAIIAVLAKYFNVSKVTTDGWEPTAPERLAKYGVECIRKSIKRDDFINVRTLVNSGSVIWYPVVFDSYNGDHYPDLLGWELGRLVDKGGKVEKGMNSTDDVADGLTGMVAPLVDLKELQDMSRRSAQISVINKGSGGGSRKSQIISAPRGGQQVVKKKQPRGVIVGRRK